MSNAAKIILDIAPLTRLPLSKSQSFSYLHNEKLPPGTLVSVPLFHRKVSGIVTGNRPDFERLGNIELKKIDSVIAENFLDEKQLNLASFISEYYFSPLGIVLKSFVPKQVKSRTAKRFDLPACRQAGKHENLSEVEPREIILTREQQTAVDKISNFKFQISNFLLYGPSASGKTEVYIHSIIELRKKDPELQFLILLPELTLTPQAIERYGEYFDPAETAVLHSKISKGQFYTNWQKIKSGTAKIIIGSRMVVFAPFQNLGLVVIDEEQDISFKQWDMNPRYDARTVAEKLAAMHQCPIVFGSATPRVESYYKAEIGEYKLLKLPRLDLSEVRPRDAQQPVGGQTSNPSTPSTTLELVDMKKERWGKNKTPISRKLRSEIAYALKNKLQTILFINKQGMSNFSVCSGCKTVLKCPKCDRALIYDKEGIYKCVHCAYKTSITPACANCKGLSFTNIGLGTQKIEREITTLFPAARIGRADNQTMQTPQAQNSLYQKFKNGDLDILVGTQMIAKGWDLPNMALVGIIDGDALLSFPDFSTREKAFQNILQAAGRVSRPGAKFPGMVLIQTFNPEQEFFRTIAAGEIEKFYAGELKARKDLALPPFGKIIKLTFQDYARKKSETEAARVYAVLEKIIAKNIKISEPQDSFVANIRGRFRRQIAIKLLAPAPPELKKILRSLPSGWIIDVDPISII